MKDPKNAIVYGYQWYQLCVQTYPNIVQIHPNTMYMQTPMTCWRNVMNVQVPEIIWRTTGIHWPKLAIPFRVYLDGKSEAKTTRDRSSQGVLIYLRSKQIVICFLSMNIPYALLVRHERCGDHADMLTWWHGDSWIMDHGSVRLDPPTGAMQPQSRLWRPPVAANQTTGHYHTGFKGGKSRIKYQVFNKIIQ